ncbi:MAG: transcription termination/antitermination protein NusA [Abitibacteriaceae bacterium]|nr:transcription termination/antitermination protein NusA [Abditibacteriaceae bacterium]
MKTASDINAELLEALKRVADEKNIPVEALVSSIEGALVSAYKKAYGGTGAVRVSADFETSTFRVFAQKRVVQAALNPNTEIAWRNARDIQPGINLGEEVEEEVTPSGFGRIAAQTAKQVLLQKLREAERVQVVSEYQDKSGEMFRGTVQRIERGNVIIAIGKAEAILPRREQVPGEGYRFGDSLYVFVVEVRNSMRGPSITVSRTHPGLVRQLFMLEVPEIADGIVELKNVAREAGQRTKIAVAANNPDVDPVGACVGPRGMRVGKVVAELGNEKVDIVRWNADPILYITNALSPAQISKVILTEDEGSGGATGTATVIVAEDQQSLAIGKQGQNVRLAAKLTGWRIDIRTEKQYAEEQAKRMFSLDGDVQPVSPTAVRESPDELAGIFSTDGLTGDESSTAETGAAHSIDLGATAPVHDIVASDLLTDTVETNGDTPAAETRADEAGSVTGGVSSVAPANSVEA